MSTAGAERCELTDLLVDQCACTRHRNISAPVQDDGPGPWFRAMFSAFECSACGLPIQEGDWIRADGRGGYEGECQQTPGDGVSLVWQPKRESSLPRLTDPES